jgi:Ras-related protein Rab-23
MNLGVVDMEVDIKVIIVGKGRVGKTSLLTRYARGAMTEDYKKTIGTDFMAKEIVLESSGDVAQLHLWDTAGQEMFSKLTRGYYRESGACVYVFSTTDRESFEAIDEWRESVEAECPGIVSVLVQNKVDLIDQAQMTPEEVEALATRLEMKLYRTSVLSNLHVDEVFMDVAEQYVAKKALESQMADSETSRRGKTKNKTAFGGGERTKTVNISQPVTRRTGGKKGFCG